MHFLFGLPSGFDGIGVIVYRFAKIEHFIPIKATFSLDKLAKLYLDKIVSQYGILVFIVSDRDSRFISKFWPKLPKALGTKLHFNSTFPSSNRWTICKDYLHIGGYVKSLHSTI